VERPSDGGFTKESRERVDTGTKRIHLGREKRMGGLVITKHNLPRWKCEWMIVMINKML
jgi:hypothetical protein